MSTTCFSTTPRSLLGYVKTGITVTDRHGNAYPMDHVGATILHPAAHCNPQVWPRPEEFLPERFFVDADSELYPNLDAYRPFEQGPRGCIGQTLVYNEIRIVMIMTARTFDIKPAYDEWDVLKEKELSVLGKAKRSIVGTPVRTMHGDRAYQTEKAGAHPVDGYPCHVSIAKGR